jgi:hypothetical protein
MDVVRDPSGQKETSAIVRSGLLRSNRLVFGEEKTDPEGNIRHATRQWKCGAKDKCRPSRYYTYPVPV